MLGPAEEEQGQRRMENLLPRDLSGHRGASHVVELAEATSMMRRRARTNSEPQDAYTAETPHRLVDWGQTKTREWARELCLDAADQKVADWRLKDQRRRQVPADENGGQRRKHGRRGKQGQGVVREDRKLTRMLRGRS
jgi:hypothetical protein